MIKSPPDLLYMYPMKYNPIRKNIAVMFPSITDYIHTILPALNKVKDHDLAIESYDMDEITISEWEFVKTNPAKAYLIDMQNPYGLNQALKLIRYIKYFHKTARIFVYGDFALNLYDDLNKLEIDFILTGYIYEQLLFILKKGIRAIDLLYPPSENKLELDNYNYISLDTFNTKSKVRRKLNPFTVMINHEPSENDIITSMSVDKITSVFTDIDNDKIKYVKLKQTEIALLPEITSGATLCVNSDLSNPNYDVIETASSIFKSVEVVIDMNTITDMENFIENISIYSNIITLSKVKIFINIHQSTIYPNEQVINFLKSDIKEIQELAKGISNKKTIKVTTDNNLAVWNTWDMDAFDLNHSLTKFFNF